MSALLIRLFIKDRDNVKDKNVRKNMATWAHVLV